MSLTEPRLAAPARSAFEQLTAQVQQLQQTGSISPTQALTLLSLAQQLQLPPLLRQAPLLGNEDRSSTIAVTNTGRRRREVRWDTSAAPRLRSPTRGGHEDVEDYDAASAAAQAPSEYAHDATAEPREDEEEEDDDVDEEGADFDTAEGHHGTGGDDAAPDALMRQAAPPRGGAGADAAASDLPGPARYALPGDDMDAAEGADELVRWPEPSSPHSGGPDEGDDVDGDHERRGDCHDGGEDGGDDDGHSGRQSPPVHTAAMAAVAASALAATSASGGFDAGAGAVGAVPAAVSLPAAGGVAGTSASSSSAVVVSSAASTAAVAGEIQTSAHLRWADDALAGGSASYGLHCSDDDGRSGTGDSAGGDDDDGGTAIGSSIAIYAGRPGNGAGASAAPRAPTGGPMLGGASAGQESSSRLDADAHTVSSLRPAGSLSRWTASEGSTVTVPVGRSTRQFHGHGGEASSTVLRQSTPPRAPGTAAAAAAASQASLPSPRSLSTASSALLAAHHDGPRRRGDSTGSASRRSLDERLVDRGVESIAADLGAPTSSSDPAELRRIAAAASTQAAAATAATMAAVSGRVIDADLISQRSSAGGDDEEDDDAHGGDTDGDEHALHDSTEAAARGEASVVSGSVLPTPRIAPAPGATVTHAGLHGPFRRGISVAAVRSESFDGSDDGSLRVQALTEAGGAAAHEPSAHHMLDALEETDADRESVLTPGTAPGGGGDGCSVTEALVQDLARERDHGDADSVHAVALLPALGNAGSANVAPAATGGAGRRPPFAPAQRGHRSRPMDARLLRPRGGVVPIGWGSGGSSIVSPTASMMGGSSTLRESGPQSMAADDGRSLGSGWSVSGSSTMARARGGGARRGLPRSSVASSIATDVASAGHTGAASVGGVRGSPRGSGSVSDGFHAQAEPGDLQRADSRLSTSSRGSSASSSLLASFSALGTQALAPATTAGGSLAFTSRTSAVSESGTSLRGVSRRRSSRHRQRRALAAGAASEQGGGVTEDEANGGASEHESQVVTAHGQDVAYAVRDRFGVDGAAGYDDEDEEGDILDDDEEAFFAGAGGAAGGKGGHFDDDDEEEEDEEEDGDDDDAGADVEHSGARDGGLIPPPQRYVATAAGSGAAAAAPPPPWQSIIEAAARGAFPDVPSLLAALMRTTSEPAAAAPPAAPTSALASAGQRTERRPPPASERGRAPPSSSTASSSRRGAASAPALAGVPRSDHARPPPPPTHAGRPLQGLPERREAAAGGGTVSVWRLPAVELVRMSVAGAADASADWWGPPEVPAAVAAAAAPPEPAEAPSPPKSPRLEQRSEAECLAPAPVAPVAAPELPPVVGAAGPAPPSAADAAAAPGAAPARRRAFERPGSAVPQRRQRQLQQQLQRQAASGEASPSPDGTPPPLPGGLSVAVPASQWVGGPATPIVPPGGGAPPRSPIARLGQAEWLELLQADYPPPDEADSPVGAAALVEPRAYRPGGSARVQNPARLAARSAYAVAGAPLSGAGGGGGGSGLLLGGGGFRRMWSASSAVVHRHRPMGAWGGSGSGGGKRAPAAAASLASAGGALSGAAPAPEGGEVDPLLLDYSVFEGDRDALPPLPWRRPRTAEARPAMAAAALEGDHRSAAGGRRPVASSRLQRAKHCSSAGSD